MTKDELIVIRNKRRAADVLRVLRNDIKKKMKKIFVTMMTACVLFVSCAHNYKYTDKNGEQKTAKTYGWADYQENRADSIEYRINIPNVVLSVVFCETVIVPVLLTGWELCEPIGIEGEVEKKSFLP